MSSYFEKMARRYPQQLGMKSNPRIVSIEVDRVVYAAQDISPRRLGLSWLKKFTSSVIEVCASPEGNGKGGNL